MGVDTHTAMNNQSLEKALQIIEFMVKYKKAARLQDIAAALKFPASTTLRFLMTLEKNGYVRQDPDSLRYFLTLKLCRLGNQVSAQYNIRDLVRPYLIELVEKVGESACLALEENHRVVYVDVESGPDNALKVMQRIGKEAPLHCTGVGKLLLLNYDQEALAQLVASEGLVQLTQHTITTYNQLLAELDRVRSEQYAVDDEECEIGARCIAAPIYDFTNKVVASISVSGPVSRMTLQKIDYIRQQVMDTAGRVSALMGFEQSETVSSI